MPRFIVSINNSINDSNIQSIKDSIVEPSAKEVVKIKNENNSIFLYTYLNDEPLKGERFFSNELWTVLFLGELIDFKTVPFQNIIENVKNKAFEEFKNFNGVFAIIVYNKKEENYYLISDRRSQYPIYYYFKDGNAIISSDLGSFCRLLDDIRFNEKWLYDFIFFHYPIGDNTFLKNIKRLAYSSVLIFNYKTEEIIFKKYADFFHKKENILKGKEGIEYAKEIFSRRVPRYFDGSDNIACSLTGGWDGRTNVVLAPDRNKITTYTYGSENCSDFIFSRKALKKIKTNHLEIIFNDEYIENLKTEMFETVFSTSGTQSIQRSTLLGVYKILADFPLVLSGISYDGLLRGNVAGPSLVSPYIFNFFSKGTNEIDISNSYDVFIGVNGEIKNEIMYKLNWIENEIGSVNSPESHLLYYFYVCDPNYFLGEYKISELYTTLRVPAWDYELIDLAFSIEQSSLKFSEILRKQRGNQDTMILQASLISEFAPELFNVPIKLTSPNEVLKNEFLFNLYGKYRRSIFKISKNIFYKYQKPLEDWNNWLNVNHKNLVNEFIFSKNSLIKNYFTQNYLDKIETAKDYNIIAKLFTTEILLRLIYNKWKRFW